ncbi:MAG: CHASE2 domain-containing protein [Deltaproteobacteria bacterium]|nr:CHASE2 domain-containing protein [Deltaproteobacteria bacterium]
MTGNSGKRNSTLSGATQKEQAIRSLSTVFSHLSASCLAILFVFVLGQFEFDGLKGFLVDVQFRLRWKKDIHPAIALIQYDDKASIRYGGQLRIPSLELSQVLGALAEEKPKAVGIITSLNEKNYSESELGLIAQSFGKVPHALVGYIDDESLGKTPPQALKSLSNFFPGFISRDNFSYGADSVSRRVMIAIEGVPTVYSELARLYKGESQPLTFRHSHRYGESGATLQTYINWSGGAGSYPTISSQLVATGQFPKDTFHNKIVLIGSSLEAKKGLDHIFTPFSREPLSTPLLEGAAQSLATLLNNNAVFKSAQWFNILLSLIVGLLTVNMVLYLSPGRGIFFVVSEVLLLFTVSWLVLAYFDCWVDLAHPFIVACVGYYLVIPYRLVDEYRKRWHYQEKSEMMAQLEQLKTNFLSLVSHDLKTPIARIQGNAELLINEVSTEGARSSVTAIIQTSDDLSQYVESILDVTRIESATVPVQKTSRDINTTILEVIDSKAFLAKEKSIEIVTELEPIFSFKYDVRLIRRVLANLVENAIKYSPSNSRINIVSKESGDWIQVSVADQGVGIALEEQEKVFSKFYRCSDASASSVKGTGLGLYLVKYFVELHRGFVELKSELGKGSIFTVSLPVS